MMEPHSSSAEVEDPLAGAPLFNGLTGTQRARIARPVGTIVSIGDEFPGLRPGLSKRATSWLGNGWRVRVLNGFVSSFFSASFAGSALRLIRPTCMYSC